jgi:hypothetical protein
MNAKELIEFLSTYDSATEVKIVIQQSHQYSIHNFHDKMTYERVKF